MPYTPSALKVFRSAWIAAPPPESEPATESARGRGADRASLRPRLPVAEVIPAHRLERRGRAVVAHGHDAGSLDDLADVRQLRAERLEQVGADGLDGVAGHRRHELVVLAARQGERERLDAERFRA